MVEVRVEMKENVTIEDVNELKSSMNQILQLLKLQTKPSCPNTCPNCGSQSRECKSPRTAEAEESLSSQLNK